MRPINRRPVNRSRDSRRFNRQSGFTKAPNLRNAPMRGGWRL